MASSTAVLEAQIQARRKAKGKPPLSPKELAKEVERERVRAGGLPTPTKDPSPAGPAQPLPPPGPIAQPAPPPTSSAPVSAPPVRGQRGGGETAEQTARRIAARDAREAAGIAPEVGQRGGGETPEQRARRQARNPAAPAPVPTGGGRPSGGGVSPSYGGGGGGAPVATAPPPVVEAPVPEEVVPPPAEEIPPPAEAFDPSPLDARIAALEGMFGEDFDPQSIFDQLEELKRRTPDWTQGGPPPSNPGWSYAERGNPPMQATISDPGPEKKYALLPDGRPSPEGEQGGPIGNYNMPGRPIFKDMRGVLPDGGLPTGPTGGFGHHGGGLPPGGAMNGPTGIQGGGPGQGALMRDDGSPIGARTRPPVDTGGGFGHHGGGFGRPGPGGGQLPGGGGNAKRRLPPPGQMRMGPPASLGRPMLRV